MNNLDKLRGESENWRPKDDYGLVIIDKKCEEIFKDFKEILGHCTADDTADCASYTCHHQGEFKIIFDEIKKLLEVKG